MTDAPSQAARPSDEPLPDPQERPAVPATRDNPGAPRPVPEPGHAAAEETRQPVLEDTIPAPDDLTDSSVDLSRIAWLITTIAFLIAMVVLGLRGDMGYAGVTLAVALAAAINLFSWGSH